MSEPLDLPNLEILIKLMGMTTSASDGEALVAIRKANSSLTRIGKTWEDVLRGKVKVIADPFDAIASAPKAQSNGASRPRTTTTPVRPWTPPAPITNRYGGKCEDCGIWVDPGAGLAFQPNQGSGWRTRHIDHFACHAALRGQVQPTVTPSGRRAKRPVNINDLL